MSGMIPSTVAASQAPAGVMPVQPGAPPQAPSPPAGPPVDPQVSMSAKPMGQDLQMYIAKGLDIISSPQTRDSILTLLKQGDPVSALANTLVVVVKKLDLAARQKGTEVADVVKMLGAKELLHSLAQVMMAAKIANLDQKHQYLAMSIAVQNYLKGEVAAGRINPAKLQQLQQASMAKLKPEQLKQIQSGAQSVQQTAMQYKGGRG